MSETYIHDNKIVATFSTVSLGFQNQTHSFKKAFSFCGNTSIILNNDLLMWLIDWRILACILAFQTPFSHALRYFPALCKSLRDKDRVKSYSRDCSDFLFFIHQFSSSKMSNHSGRTLPVPMGADGQSERPRPTRRSFGKIYSWPWSVSS